MNAVDRFSNAMAQYRQLPPQPQTLPAYPQPPAAQPPRRSDLDKALDKVAEVTPILSRMAALANRIQNPAGAVNSVQVYPAYPGYPATPPIAPAQGPLGQSLQRLGQAVGSSDVDHFVRQAAPVIDEALPLIEDIVNLTSGKSRQPVQAASTYPYQPYGAPNPQPTIAQQVAPIVDGVSSLVNLIGGLFKR